MWRRALLAAAAVSYLICVLIMSGMQKEDLDVSMLGKLQRYNVNFDDINNEQIRQQCASRNNGFTTDGQKQIKEVYESTTEYKPTIGTKNLSPSVNLNLDSVMEYLKTRENSIRNLDEITTEKTTSKHQGTVTHVMEVIEDKPTINMDSLRRFFKLETQKKTFYKIDDGVEAAKYKTNEKHLISADDDTINKLIKDYLLKKQKITTTTERSTTRFTIDIQNIYRQIDEIIANRSNIDNERVKTDVNYQNNGEQSNIKHNDNSPVQVTPSNQNGLYPTGKQLFENFYYFLNEMNHIRNDSSRPYLTYDNNISKDTPQTSKLLEAVNKNYPENNKESTTHKSKIETEPDEKALKPSLVKEIAETVKNVLIKDLRNELAGIYLKTQTTTPITSTTVTTTTTTTTETVPTTPLKNRIEEKDMAIMDKFMDLYEQIKSLKQATYLLRVTNESTTFVNKLKRPNDTPQKSAMTMPTVIGIPIQEPKVLISSIDNYNAKPFFNYKSYLPKRGNNRLPITIQTNSVEIKPLAVPVAKSESLVRQNIIVHMGNRYQHKDHNNYKYFNYRARNTDSEVPVNHKNRTFNNYIPKRYDGYSNSARIPHNLQEPRQTEDVIRFKVRDNGNARLDTDYYEKINFENNNGGNENRGIFNDHKYPRFHERLERIDPGSDGAPVVSDVDIKDKNVQNSDFPSRHQLSLVDIKRGTSYDDAHFKNFIKTQQKVTDMLERILAVRPKTNTPRSVETV